MTNKISYTARKIWRPSTIAIDGVAVSIDRSLMPPRVVRSLYEGTYEDCERGVLRRNLKTGDRVLEIGAGIGLITAFCCKIVGSEFVTAYEANSRVHRLLERNLALNGVTPTIRTELISNSNGQETFFLAHNFLGSSRFERKGSKETLCQTRTFSEALEKSKPTFLVVDAEGSEIDFFQPEVDLGMVTKICLEVHPHIVGDRAISETLAILISKGFSLMLQEGRGKVLFLERTA